MNLFSLFAVLLIVTQASVPVPRQTPQAHAQKDGHVQPDTQRKNGDPNKLPALGKPVKPDGTQGDADGNQSDKNPRVISISKLPPIAMEAHPLSGSDWTILVFNGLLVLVGGTQSFYVAKTLGAINQQAKSLKQQNDNYERRERARIAVEILPIDNEAIKMSSVMWGPQFRLLNIGQTPAHNIRMEISYKVCASTVPEELGKKSEIATPRVLKANAEDETTRYLPPLMPPEISDILGERKFLHLSGKVTYNIALDDKDRETGFHYLWMVLNYKLGNGKDWNLSSWVAHSPSDYST